MSTGARLRLILRKTRARLRHGLGLALRPLLGTRGNAPAFDPAAIRSVLVVRINGRLGNTLFMTPLLRQLHALLPHSSIDLAVSYPNAATLLAGTPGLDRVIVFPHKGGAGMAGRYLVALRAVRQRRYDLLVDPDPFSTSSRIVQLLSHTRFRLGFDSPMQWAPLTHAVPMPQQPLHMARSPAYLLARGFDLPWEPQGVRLWLPVTAAEVTTGHAAIDAALAKAGAMATPPPPTTLGFFAHATGLKDVGRQWWLDFWAAFLALAPEARPVEFLPTATTPPVNPAYAALNLPSQRLLTAAISTTRLFIAADGGPLHLAGCAGTPVIGLFNGHTDPLLYGPLKPEDLSIDVRGRTPAEVAKQVFEVWRQQG